MSHSLEQFSFNFKAPPSNIQFKRPPSPNSRLCVIQTYDGKYIESNSTSGSISLSNTLLGANNYFYIIFSAEESYIRICSAINNCFLSIGEDTLIYSQHDEQLATNFHLFVKVSLY